MLIAELTHFVKVFVDNINIHSIMWEEHVQHIDTILSKLKNVNLKLNLDKRYFGKKEVTILGFMVLEEGSKFDPNKVEAMLRFSTLRMAIDVRCFNGLDKFLLHPHSIIGKHNATPIQFHQNKGKILMD